MPKFIVFWQLINLHLPLLIPVQQVGTMAGNIYLCIVLSAMIAGAKAGVKKYPNVLGSGNNVSCAIRFWTIIIIIIIFDFKPARTSEFVYYKSTLLMERRDI